MSVRKLISLIFIVALGLRAGEAAAEPEKNVIKPMTWRPFPKEAPEVLFFDSFEAQPGWIKTGKFAEESGAPSGKGVLKLDLGKDASTMKGLWGPTPLKIPSGLEPRDITISFMIYSDEAGQVTVTCTHPKGNYADASPVPKTKGWGTLSVKLSDMVKDKKHTAEPEQVLTDIEIAVRPNKGKKEIPKAMIDDFIVTWKAAPAEVKPRVLAADKKRLDMERRADRDGFAYSLHANESLKDAIKPHKSTRKPKAVLVLGATPAETDAWVKTLASTPKTKADGFNFSPADGPEPGAIGGLADMRTLIQFNLAKNPGMALFLIGAADALGPGRPSESVRVVMERALATGTIPVVVLPAPEKADQIVRLSTFARTVQERCIQLGVPCIDASHFLTKDVKGLVEPTKLAVVPQEKLVALTLLAMKHCHDSLEKN